MFTFNNLCNIALRYINNIIVVPYNTFFSEISPFFKLILLSRHILLTFALTPVFNFESNFMESILLGPRSPITALGKCLSVYMVM